MLNKPHQLLEQLGKQVEWVKEKCKSVRVYDLEVMRSTDLRLNRAIAVLKILLMA